ncbi:hypothetical protein FGB62_410g00 [Gracilaria domingensis]|nr:hypothetical protein FGB62_410g00 [Gracilaria domingensis]
MALRFTTPCASGSWCTGNAQSAPASAKFELETDRQLQIGGRLAPAQRAHGAHVGVPAQRRGARAVAQPAAQHLAAARLRAVGHARAARPARGARLPRRAVAPRRQAAARRAARRPVDGRARRAAKVRRRERRRRARARERRRPPEEAARVARLARARAGAVGRRHAAGGRELRHVVHEARLKAARGAPAAHAHKRARVVVAKVAVRRGALRGGAAAQRPARAAVPRPAQHVVAVGHHRGDGGRRHVVALAKAVLLAVRARHGEAQPVGAELARRRAHGPRAPAAVVERVARVRRRVHHARRRHQRQPHKAAGPWLLREYLTTTCCPRAYVAAGCALDQSARARARARSARASRAGPRQRPRRTPPRRRGGTCWPPSTAAAHLRVRARARRQRQQRAEREQRAQRAAERRRRRRRRRAHGGGGGAGGAGGTGGRRGGRERGRDAARAR